MKIIPKIKRVFSILFKKFKTSSLKKKVFFIGILVIVALFLIFQFYKLNQPPPYTTQKAIKSDITEIVSETGNITPTGAINVYSPTNGVVTDVYVSNGEKVVEDQELFTVKSTATEQEQQQAYANYLTSQASLNTALSDQDLLRSNMYTAWKTFLDLATNSTYENGDKTPNVEKRTAAEFQVAQDIWHASEKKYQDQQAVIAQAQAQSQHAYLLYQATQNAVVKAQTDGTVSNLSIKTGGSVIVYNPSMPPVPVLVLTSGTTDEAVIALGESDIVKIKPGQVAKITVSAAGNKEYGGKVLRIDSIGTSNQGVITYNVYLKIEKADDQLRPGMSIDTEITTKKVSNILSVPNASIKPYQGGKAVRIPGKKKNDVIFVPVETGIRGKDNTQIINGIKEDQTVITALSNEQLKRSSLLGL